MNDVTFWSSFIFLINCFTAFLYRDLVYTSLFYSLYLTSFYFIIWSSSYYFFVINNVVAS